ILGSSAKPNQMIINGAIATIGMVWEEISSGTGPRRTSGEKSITMAVNHANANETAKHSSETLNVARACAPSALRCSQPELATSVGAGSTCGRTAVKRTTISHAISSTARKPAGTQIFLKDKYCFISPADIHW